MSTYIVYRISIFTKEIGIVSHHDQAHTLHFSDRNIFTFENDCLYFALVRRSANLWDCPRCLSMWIYFFFILCFLFADCMSERAGERAGERASEEAKVYGRTRNHLVFHILNSPKVAKTHSTEENLFIVLTLLMYRFKSESFAGMNRRESTQNGMPQNNKLIFTKMKEQNKFHLKPFQCMMIPRFVMDIFSKRLRNFTAFFYDLKSRLVRYPCRRNTNLNSNISMKKIEPSKNHLANALSFVSANPFVTMEWKHIFVITLKSFRERAYKVNLSQDLAKTFIAWQFIDEIQRYGFPQFSFIH